MSVADLTGTTWLFDSILDNLSPAPITYHLNFTSNNTSYTTIGWTNNGKSGYSVSYDSTQIYTNGVWGNDAYKTITISGGTDATNANLISRIELNATQVITSHDVTISYNNSTIAYLDASGTEILDTACTYMIDDISIEYTSSGGTDVSDTTATASDVLSGKYFYTSAGVKTQGTMSVYAGALRGE